MDVVFIKLISERGSIGGRLLRAAFMVKIGGRKAILT